jgi:hypothetical protein
MVSLQPPGISRNANRLLHSYHGLDDIPVGAVASMWIDIDQTLAATGTNF